MSRTFRYSSCSNKSLSKNNLHCFAQKYSLRLYRSNSVYSFIPKNACSTLRLSLALYNGCIDNKNDFDWIHENNFTFQADLASLCSASYTFTVLRCPYSRLASVYLDKIVGKEFPAIKLYGGLNFSLPGMRWATVRRLNGILSNSFLSKLSFYDFVDCLRSEEVKKLDMHWQPQVDFLVYENYDEYFCVEELRKAVSTLKEKIGLEVIDARGLTLHGIKHFEKVTGKDFSKTPASQILAMKKMGRVPSPFHLYNEKIVEMVSEIYAPDIKLYKSLFGDTNLMFSH
ncbi:MAG: sulfotransferase family 2 domain-containing protein [Cyanobacteria bacterium J06632_3]